MRVRAPIISAVTPLIQQIESLMFILVLLACLVAISASTFLILALSKALDLLPFGPGGEHLREQTRSDSNSGDNSGDNE